VVAYLTKEGEKKAQTKRRGQNSLLGPLGGPVPSAPEKKDERGQTEREGGEKEGQEHRTWRFSFSFPWVAEIEGKKKKKKKKGITPGKKALVPANANDSRYFSSTETKKKKEGRKRKNLNPVEFPA